MSTQAAKAKKDPEFVLDADVSDFDAHDEIRESTPKERSPKVNINSLMDRVREEKKKEKKENLIFLGLIASVVLITGAIASF
jgi:hypothetical protein|tara:strand:- start:429 stop:674 length:246 start_codon:yes stop_codon:yes gene_type:complete